MIGDLFSFLLPLLAQLGASETASSIKTAVQNKFCPYESKRTLVAAGSLRRNPGWCGGNRRSVFRCPADGVERGREMSCSFSVPRHIRTILI